MIHRDLGFPAHADHSHGLQSPCHGQLLRLLDLDGAFRLLFAPPRAIRGPAQIDTASARSTSRMPSLKNSASVFFRSSKLRPSLTPCASVAARQIALSPLIVNADIRRPASNCFWFSFSI